MRPARVGAPSRLHVLVVSGFGVLGGAERWLLRLLDATDRIEGEAILLGPGPLSSELDKRGLPAVIFSTGAGPVAVGKATSRVLGHLRRHRPEVVLANGVKAAAAAVPASRLAGVPVVWCKHDLAKDASLARPLGRWCDRVVAASARAGLATGRDDVAVIPPPRPPPPLPRGEARDFWASVGVPFAEGRTLAMVGRLLPMKGVEDAIASLALSGGAGWRLVVVGEDDYSAPGHTERLRALAAQLGVDERVHFSGWVEDAGRLLAGFDAVAVLSKRGDKGVEGEGFGMAVLEGMLAGVPVIATTEVAAAEGIDGTAGLAVAPGAPAAVARALHELSAPGVAADMGRAGRRIAMAHPDAATLSAELAGVLAAAARRPGAGLADGPPVSVVTTMLNEERTVTTLLKGLRGQLGDQDEVVVVDGGSHDRTVEKVASFAGRDRRFRLISVPGSNISEGRNAGVLAARHEVIACTDAGCQPMSGWLDALRRAFADAPPPDLVTGIYSVDASGSIQHALAAANYPEVAEARGMTGWRHAYGRVFGRVFDPTLPTGRSMAFRRSAWRAVGGFPRQLGTAEDVMFGQALSRAGARCLLALDAAVVWQQRPSLIGTVRMYYGYGRGDGAARDPLLVARNLARLLAYGAGAFVAVRGRRLGRLLAAAGAGVYFSLPLARAWRRPKPALVVALVPLALSCKDLAKAAGCLRGLFCRRADVRPSVVGAQDRGTGGE